MKRVTEAAPPPEVTPAPPAPPADNAPPLPEDDDAAAQARLDDALGEQKDGPGTPDGFPRGHTDEARAIAAIALTARRLTFDPTNVDYLARKWTEFHQALGSQADWGSATTTQQSAFRRLLLSVTRDAQKED